MTDRTGFNDDGTLDEVIALGANIHIEQMSPTHWWMGIQTGSKYITINFSSKKEITALYQEDI